MNREYKSDVFSLIMKNPKHALQVYNSLNGTNYEDESLITIYQLEKGISLTVRNDASFIIDSHLNLYEHQSTFNPNMPVRSLIYVAFLLERLLKDQNLYGKKRIMLPVIHCVVFYNGPAEQPAKQILKLSDSYIHYAEVPDVEIRCTMININAGHNDELLDSCSVLKEYMIFVDKVRNYHNTMALNDALEQSIDECISENVMKDFFITHRQEVTKVAMLDYTFEKQIELEKKESKAEGKTECMEEVINGVISICSELGLTQEQIIIKLTEKLPISPADAKKYVIAWVQTAPATQTT